MTRLLDPEDFGLIGIALAVNGIAGIFVNFGFASYIIQQSTEKESVRSTIFWFNVFVSVILFSALCISAPFIADFYEMPELESIIYITAVVLCLNLLNSVPNSLLIKRMLFKEINLRNVFIAIIAGVIGIIMALYGYGVWALVTQQLLLALLMFFITFKIARWIPKRIFDKIELKKSYDFGKYMFLAGLLDGIYSRLDVFLIGKLFSVSNLGLYTRAQSLDKTITGLSSSSLLGVLFPALAKIKTEHEKLKNIYHTYFEHICFAFCLLAAFMFVIAKPLFLILFGIKWVESADYFRLLVLSGFAYPLSSLMLSIIEARGNSRSFFFADLVKKLIFFPSYVVLFYFSVEVFLIVMFFLNLLGTIVNLVFLNKELKVGYSQSANLFLIHFIPSIVAAVILDLMFPSGVNILQSLLKLTIVILLFLGTAHLRNSKTLSLIVSMVKNYKRQTP